MSVTANFLKLRSTSSSINLNQWHNNFSAVKKLSDSKNIPLIAVWSNGDKCGHCTMFEQVLMKSIFKKWMKTSQCYFWFAYYGDTNKEDKFEGTGFKWCYNSGKGGNSYPFVRIYWKSGKVDVTKNGGSLSGDSNKDSNATKLVKNIKNYLKNYKPVDNTNKPTDECDDCIVPEPIFVAPVLTSLKNSDGTFSLLVNNKLPSSITEKEVNYIIEKYNSK